jgi:hypothetical protein
MEGFALPADVGVSINERRQSGAVWTEQQVAIRALFGENNHRRKGNGLRERSRSDTVRARVCPVIPAR